MQRQIPPFQRPKDPHGPICSPLPSLARADRDATRSRTGVSAGSRREDVIDRPKGDAAAGLPFFLRVDVRNRVPAVTLFAWGDGDTSRLGDGDTSRSSRPRPMFAVTETFAVEFDPAEPPAG
ncbi:hypothetical protein JCM9533A_71340 [Catenuloplanes niger JCM 9533]